MNYGQQVPMLTQAELAEIMAQQQNQPSYGHGFADAEHAQSPPMQHRPQNYGQNQPRPSPSAPHASEEARDYDGPRGRGNQRGQPRGGRGGPAPQSSEESDRPGPVNQGNRRPPSNGYNNGPRGNSHDSSYESEERPSRGAKIQQGFYFDT